MLGAILTALPYALVLHYETYNALIWASLGSSMASLFVPNKTDKRGLVRSALVLLAAVFPVLDGVNAKEVLAYALILYASALFIASYEIGRPVVAGVLVAVVYSLVTLTDNARHPYLLYPETLIGVAVATLFVRMDLNDWWDSELFDRVLLALAISIPF
ncbi:MAG: hypothetical protein ACP5HQ_03420 [Thermoprotei archaeon]